MSGKKKEGKKRGEIALLVRVVGSYNSNVFMRKDMSWQLPLLFLEDISHSALQKHKAQLQGPHHYLLVNNRIQEWRLDAGDQVDPLPSLSGKKSRTE